MRKGARASKLKTVTLPYRRAFFYGTVLTFIILGTYLFLIMKGLVFTGGSISPTGGIFLNITPSNPSLFVNGEHYRVGSSLFNTGTLVTELSGGQYHLLVAKDGFTSWEKVLTVSPGNVTARNFIHLFPATPVRTVLSSTTVREVQVVPDGFVFRTASGTLELADGTRLPGTSFGSIDSRSPTFVAAKKNHSLVFVDTRATNSDPTDLTGLFADLGFTPSFVLPHPFSPQRIILASGRTVFSLDVKRGSAEQMLTLPKPIRALAVSNGGVFASDGSTLSSLNLVFGSVNHYPIKTARGTLSPSPSGGYVAIREKGNVAVYNLTASTTELFAEPAGAYAFSPEERRFALSSERTVTVRYLDEWHTDLQKKAGAKTILALNEGEPVTNLSWLDPQHLLIQRGSELSTLEIDEELPLNTARIARNVSSFSYRYGDDSVYVLTTDGTFERIDLK